MMQEADDYVIDEDNGSFYYEMDGNYYVNIMYNSKDIVTAIYAGFILDED